MNGAILAIAPLSPSVSIFSDFYPRPQNLPHNRLVLPAGNAPESFESEGGSAPPSRDRRSHGAGEAASKGSPAATTGGACWTST